ncbi:spidroin-1-like [Iris pallida]|uniref:Spidroin-1-like n=1 Tax=Iris pallida TaxID=29817 RepID=A0AAX6FBA2_IRIPA|nr:spidroin-1-like [Iris pallida]
MDFGMFSFWKFSETFCDLWMESDFRNYFGSSRLFCGLLWIFFIYKMWVFPWFGTCRNYRRQFSSFWVDQKQRRCCPIFP